MRSGQERLLWRTGPAWVACSVAGVPLSQFHHQDLRLPYFLAYGSALAALREGQFQPPLRLPF